jgi:hypothetical protein
MKKHLSTLLILFFVLPTIWANKIYFNITQEMSVNEIHAGIFNLSGAATINDTIIVTGSKTGANKALTLFVDTEKNLIWQATYQSSVLEGDCLIFIYGGGTLEVNGALITENAYAIYSHSDLGVSTVIVSGEGKIQTSGEGYNAICTYGNVIIKDNAQLSGTTGEVVKSFGDNAVITVTGGTITATSENAIMTKGRNPKIYISGGYLSNNAVGNFPVVYAYDPNYNSQALVHLSGAAKVEAKGDGCAIISTGNVWVTENAEVSNNTGGDDITPAIEGSATVLVTDNAKVSARNDYTILCTKDVIISGNARVEAKDNAIGVIIYGNGAYGSVEVKDQAQIIAENNYAIAHTMPNATLTVSGGLVFAYGKAMSDVVDFTNFSGPAGSGVVLAWNKEAGNTNYEMFSTDDIFKLPETATAFWDKKGAEFGVSYANGDNTGFIPLNVNVLSVNETASSNIRVYPNPTTGEVWICDMRYGIYGNGACPIVEVYDIFGRRQKAEGGRQNVGAKNFPPSQIEINISHLPSGVYFLRVENEVVKVVKM